MARATKRAFWLLFAVTWLQVLHVMQGGVQDAVLDGLRTLLLYAVMANVCVLTAWNLWGAAEDAAERRREEGELADFRKKLNEACTGSHVPVHVQAEVAFVPCKIQAGSSLKYMGPPPVHTPARGEPAVVTKSECDMRGAPMDVARCTASTPYFCRDCRARDLPL